MVAHCSGSWDEKPQLQELLGCASSLRDARLRQLPVFMGSSLLSIGGALPMLLLGCMGWEWFSPSLCLAYPVSEQGLLAYTNFNFI